MLRNVLLSSIVCLMTLAGCSQAVHIHPITDTDMYVRENGDVCFDPEYFEHAVATIIKEK